MTMTGPPGAAPAAGRPAQLSPWQRFVNQALLVLALALAVLGQHYFMTRNEYFWDGVFFFLLAIVVFFIRQGRAPEEMPPVAALEPAAAPAPLPEPPQEDVIVVAPVTALTLAPAAALTPQAPTAPFRVLRPEALSLRSLLAALNRARRSDPLRVAAFALGLIYMVGAMATSAGLGAERTVGPLPFLIWLASILLVSGALVDRSRLQALATWRAWAAAHRVELAVVGAITLIGFLLRVVGSGDTPYTVSGFEGSMGLEIRAALGGDLTNRFTLGWGAQPTMAYWVLGWPATFLGAQLSVFRLMPALFGALSIPATYALARLLFDRRVAVVAALFLLGHHAGLHFSRIVTVQIADVFWVALVLVLLVLARRTRDPLLWFATGLAAGASSYFFQGARIILVIVALYALVLELRARREGRLFLRQHARHLALLGLGALLVAGPLWAMQAQHGARFGPRLFEQSALDSAWLEAERGRTGANTLGVLVNRQLLPSLQAFVMLPDKGETYRADMPILDYTSGLFFVLGLVYALLQIVGRRGDNEHGDQPYALVQIGLWTPVLLISVLTIGVPNVGRFLMALPFVAILVGIGIVQIVELVLRALGTAPALHAPRTALYALIAAALVLVNLNAYFGDYVPSAVYADLNSHAAAAIGRYLRDQGPGVRAYFFGPPRLFANSEIIKVLAYEVEMVEIPPGAPLPQVATDKTPLFVALPEHQPELAAAQERYPGGRLQTIWSPYQSTASDPRLLREPLFVTYEVGGQ